MVESAAFEDPEALMQIKTLLSQLGSLRLRRPFPQVTRQGLAGTRQSAPFQAFCSLFWWDEGCGSASEDLGREVSHGAVRGSRNEGATGSAPRAVPHTAFLRRRGVCFQRQAGFGTAPASQVRTCTWAAAARQSFLAGWSCPAVLSVALWSLKPPWKSRSLEFKLLKGSTLLLRIQCSNLFLFATGVSAFKTRWMW